MIRKWFKRKKKYPQIKAEPGQILELVDQDGILVRKVILSDIRFSNIDGVSVEFEDYARYLRHSLYS